MPGPGLIVGIRKDWKGNGALVREAILTNLDDLYRFALHLTRDAEHANELVQECALRALKAQNTVFRDPRSWLFQTLYHTFVDHYRKRGSRGTYEEDLSGEETETESIADLLPSVIAREDVQNAVEKLPLAFRAVVWLSDAEDVPLREIAEILGCPLGTVASRLTRGRQELRRLLSIYARRGEKLP
jgi:RNA polymerase sigma-70 factor, ECF subfamily